ncbi:hypothetical protein [uncultured Dysosmobacter sp.]|uniref:hypothetical protein n=1 Tax=uncultured Dysosmobacter sp. TaxID=2591384 RepID=UPI00260B277F|nr:hypothetical protein [uncultured Dysosmobacter sp.]
MPKNPKNGRSKPVKRDEPMTGTMKFFLVCCVAELYLLLIRRFYINADSELQRIAWFDTYLWVLAGAGAVILAVGVALSLLWRADKRKRVLGWGVTGVGLFAAAAALLVRWNMSTLTLLVVVVPVVMLLGILWSLYDRECALSLTILGVSLIVLWVCRRVLSSVYLGLYVKIAAAVYLVLLAAVVYLTKNGKLGRLLPPKADPLPVYVACGLSIAAIAVALVSSTIAYYAMWALAMVVFGLAVYYTVKQL